LPHWKGKISHLLLLSFGCSVCVTEVIFKSQTLPVYDL
jgi:hypothetical protein